MISFLKSAILRRINASIRILATGFDVSDSSIKYLKFHPDTRAIEAFGAFTVPEGVIEHGEIKKEDDLIILLRSWLSKEGKQFQNSFVVVSLPEEKSFSRLIQIPKIREGEIANAVRWEIEANVPLSPDELSFDFEKVEGEYAEHIDVVISAFPKGIVESYIRVLDAVGLKPLAIELESQAIARSLLPMLREDQAKIIIDIGYNRTGIIILAGKTILYTTTIDFGGRQLEKTISQNLNMSQNEAITLKKEKGLEKQAYGGKLFGAFVVPLAVLAEETRRAMEYYRNHSVHSHDVREVVSEVLLVGGDANLLGLETYLSVSLKIPVRKADPLEPVYRAYKVPPLIMRRQAYAYATAVGLALRGISSSNQ